MRELDEGEGYSVVKVVRECLEEGYGAEVGVTDKTLWCSLIPRKINIFMWRARMARLPTQVAINDKGIDIDTVLCLRCGEIAEDIDHALVSCKEVKNMWERVGRWWNKPLSGVNLVSQLTQEDEELLEKSKGKSLWVGAKWALCYLIWHNRNGWAFKGDKCRIREKYYEWQLVVFEWLSRRSKSSGLSWNSWLAGICG